MYENLSLGAHLVTRRKRYSHHGIYVGKGRVIRYAGLCHGICQGPVEEVSIEQFAREGGFFVRTHGVPVFSHSEIVTRARARLGENRYHLLRNNCEHFCEWCVTSCKRSRQVEKWLALPKVLPVRALRRAARALLGEGLLN